MGLFEGEAGQQGAQPGYRAAQDVAHLELFEGRRYKSYRGMGSMGAMQGLGADRYASAQTGSSDGSRSALGAATRS